MGDITNLGVYGEYNLSCWCWNPLNYIKLLLMLMLLQMVCGPASRWCLCWNLRVEARPHTALCSEGFPQDYSNLDGSSATLWIEESWRVRSIREAREREREWGRERESNRQRERERERTEPYRTCKKLFLGPTPQVEVVWVPGMHCWYVSVSLQSTFKMVPKMPSLTLSMYCTHKIVNIHQSFLSKKNGF